MGTEISWLSLFQKLDKALNNYISQKIQDLLNEQRRILCKFLFLVEFILCLNRLYYDFCPKGTFKNEFEHFILFYLKFPKKFSSNSKAQAKRSATDNKNAFQVRTPGPHDWKNILAEVRRPK